ncbi:MAG: DUF1844 domain-containing protein [Nitrospirae bacterium]|nr:DUF1844 domain-containing protein [Nitrospirota bacterium]MBF0590573.1 DUF1844 domain-containing protein [Nitrospirota bacterium]
MDREEGMEFEFRDKRRLNQDEALEDKQSAQEASHQAHCHDAQCHEHMHPPYENAGEEVVMPEVNFINFVANLSTDAIISLGLVQDPQGQTYTDLPVAKYIIDVITMLQEKTIGNLDDSENQQITDMLHQLRMAYANIAGQP